MKINNVFLTILNDQQNLIRTIKNRLVLRSDLTNR
jgi:hypothetical protein